MHTFYNIMRMEIAKLLKKTSVFYVSPLNYTSAVQ